LLLATGGQVFGEFKPPPFSPSGWLVGGITTKDSFKRVLQPQVYLLDNNHQIIIPYSPLLPRQSNKKNKKECVEPLPPVFQDISSLPVRNLVNDDMNICLVGNFFAGIK